MIFQFLLNQKNRYLDIYEPHQGGTNKLYRNEDDGSFTEIPGAWGLFNTGWTRSAIWGDYDNDGDLDFVLRGSVSPDQLDDPTLPGSAYAYRRFKPGRCRMGSAVQD